MMGAAGTNHELGKFMGMPAAAGYFRYRHTGAVRSQSPLPHQHGRSGHRVLPGSQCTLQHTAPAAPGNYQHFIPKVKTKHKKIGKFVLYYRNNITELLKSEDKT